MKIKYYFGVSRNPIQKGLTKPAFRLVEPIEASKDSMANELFMCEDAAKLLGLELGEGTLRIETYTFKGAIAVHIEKDGIFKTKNSTVHGRYWAIGDIYSFLGCPKIVYVKGEKND